MCNSKYKYNENSLEAQIFIESPEGASPLCAESCPKHKHVTRWFGATYALK
jgi:hypothetical protein